MWTSWRPRPRTSTTWSVWRTGTAASERAPAGPPAEAFLGLGSNVGDRRAHLADALRGLARVGQIGAVSSVYRSDAVGFRDQPEFWNLVARLRTRLEPGPLLLAVKTLETELGRTPTFRQGPREIDIDLLLYGDRVIDSPGLALPHPRMMERAFVLAPLVEIAPDYRHPATHVSFAERLARGDLEAVERMFDGVTLLTGGEEP